MGFKTLLAYQKGFNLAMEIFHLTKEFPKSEMFGLSSQIVRSSRSVCSNITEGYRKRQYEKHFKSKMSDADSENSETQLWLEFALACEYISEEKFEDLTGKSKEVGKLINYMMNNPDKFK
ncbi:MULTISPECIES: four helix bundle protein [Winogradskyella]|uniref:Four helix bundle protein n=1 Tax=Winogradskyella ouciana TaxID=2608631 RepID=A0A7K1G8C6_9FLAO|nr:MULTISPECIES: four helix bundle protein [Winogradskyella]MBO6880553.1 four helix bundle protein [Winogradskyella sp.]MTE25532.1 four helix bundle protein [Winogradskyella ouciana]